MKITSFRNPKIKHIRQLQHKKYRQDTGQFFIEGLRVVGEAIQTGAQIEAIITAPDLLISDFGKELLDHPGINNVETIEVTPEIFTSLAQKEGPQGIGAVINQNWEPLQDLKVQMDDFFVILDQIADPGNLGTIMRTAEAVGARGVILLGHSTDPFDPTSVKASMGAIFSLSLVKAQWQDVVAWCRDHRVILIGTSDRAEKEYRSVEYHRPLGLLMGSERHGLPQSLLDACDHTVRIPMEGRSDSLNLAVATGVMLYEIYHQTRKADTIQP